MVVISAQGNADGAYFGTTFPHLLLMTYPSLRPPRPTETYIPRVFGFKLHPTAIGCDLPAAVASKGSGAGPSTLTPMDAYALSLECHRDVQLTKNEAEAASGDMALKERRGKRREDERDEPPTGVCFPRSVASDQGGRQNMEIHAS